MNESTVVWDPLSFLEKDSTEKFALIILNSPIIIRKDIVTHLWNKSAIRVTVDGGTDRWLRWLDATRAEDVVNSGNPDLVTGDFDSIHPETLTMLQERSVSIVETKDQDHTDFTKAINCILERTNLRLLVVLSEISGRLDQILSQLNTLHTCGVPTILLSSACATWILNSGYHEIRVAKILKKSILAADRWVALLPVGSPTTATTTGLKWNLENTEMKFGGLVSSSNTYNNDPVVSVANNQPLVWSMGLSLED